MSSPIQHCSSDMMHSGSWNEMRKRNKTSSFASPFMKKSPINKGCAKSDGGPGCVQKRGGEYVIINNKKPDNQVWKSGFSSKAEANEALAGYHANK